MEPKPAPVKPLPKSSATDADLLKQEQAAARRAAKAEKYGDTVPKIVQSRINIRLGNSDVKSSGLNYALSKHGGVDMSNKSQFSIPRE